MPAPEHRDQVGRQTVPQRQVGDAELAFLRGDMLLDLSQSLVLNLDEAHGVREQDLAGPRQADDPSASIEQVRPELLFQGLNT